jgi:hypothetical protein
MAHPNVKQGSLAAGSSSVDSLSAFAIVAPATAPVLVMADVPGAANDAIAAAEEPIRNPLWIIAIGMACVFGAMAAVMAVG